MAYVDNNTVLDPTKIVYAELAPYFPGAAYGMALDDPDWNIRVVTTDGKSFTIEGTTNKDKALEKLDKINKIMEL